MPQTCCELTDRAFSRREARKELASYLRIGPGGTTREIVNNLRACGISNAALLDIGGGIGVIHHELLEGAAR